MQRRYKQYWCAAVLATVGLSACATHPVPQAQHNTAQGFAAEKQNISAGTTDERSKTNVPSAPYDTPICGSSLHEQSQVGGRLYTQGLTSGNSCAQNACFQPLTGTYITQNGTNSVCR